METASEKQLEVALKTFKPRVGTAATLFTILISLLLLTLLALGVGYLWGKFQSLPKTGEKKQESVKKEAQLGKGVYSDTVNGFSLNYPNPWTAEKRSSGIPGLKLSQEASTVEIWLSVSQPVTLSSEQKEALVTTNQLNLKIDNRTAKMTEYIYSAGNYFSIVTLATVGQKPLVTFWVKAESQEIYNQAKEIVQSFTFD